MSDEQLTWNQIYQCVAYLLAHPELQVEDPAFDTWCDQVIAAQEKAKASI